MNTSLRRAHRSATGLLAACLVWFHAGASADGLIIDKIYHPYVDAGKKELELRSSFLDRARNDRLRTQVHQLAIGSAVGDHHFAEINLIGTGADLDDIRLEAMEAEFKWQIGEQGEYSADWGLLFDYEHDLHGNGSEASFGLLGEKEFGRWSGTLNLLLANEWGADIHDELETRAGAQLRYRYSARLEPGIELYAGQRANGIGPVLQGALRFGSGRTLHWESGLIIGLDNRTARSTARFLLEYEF